MWTTISRVKLLLTEIKKVKEQNQQSEDRQKLSAFYNRNPKFNPRIKMSDLDKIVEILQKSGYAKAEGDDGLGHKEYALVTAAGKRMLVFGPGRIGDEGMVMNMYFTLNGELLEHGVISE